MRSAPFVFGGALAVASALVVATPANAAVERVVITDALDVHATAQTLAYGAYTPWEPEGPATFPSTVTGGGAGYVLQGYQPELSSLAEGCVAVSLISFSVELELVQPAPARSEIGVSVGIPASGVTGTVSSFVGTGTAAASGG